MRHETIGIEYRAGCLGLITFVAALGVASDAGAGATCPSFPAPTFLQTHGVSDAVAVADVDGDGVPDLVSANNYSDDISVLLGNGDGNFQAAVAFPAGEGPRDIDVADLDGDGALDLVTANRGSFPSPGDVSVLLGNGDGSFQAAASVPAGDDPGFLALADFDGDGVPDLVTGSGSPEVNVLLGNGDGSFQAAVSFPAGRRIPRSVAVADFNGDSALDLVTVHSSGVTVLLGNGDGSFQAALDFLPGRFLSPKSVGVADLDGDGSPDLVVAGFDGSFDDSSGVSVLLGNGDGSFQAAVSFAGGFEATAVAVADLDGDSVSDVVTTDQARDGVVVLLGNGDGSLQAPVYYLSGAGSHPRSIALADLDGDAVPDLVTVNNGVIAEGDLSVLLGNGDGSFHATPSFPVGPRPYSVAVGDLNGDRVPDLITAGGAVNVLFGKGNGSFQAATSVADGEFISVAVADLNGDRIPDLVSGPSTSPENGVVVLLGNGDGSFQSAVSFATGAYLTVVAVADLDGDSIPDLVTANNYSGTSSVLLGNGDGSFRPAVLFEVGASPSSIAVADLGRDGIPDLVITHDFDDHVNVLRGNGDGSFRPAVLFEVGANPSSAAVADLDGDGIPDVVTSDYGPFTARNGGVSVLLGNGDGSFQDAASYPASGRPISVAVADLDGDSVLDVVTASRFASVEVLRGNGDGSFQSALVFEAGRQVSSVAVADLDSDGDSDIVTSNESSGDVTVLINQCDPPAFAVDLDIKPGSDPNPINPSVTGVFPVAILGSESFDVADVDGKTLRFGPNEASLAHWRGPHYGDVNGDGVTDLLAHFRVEDTGIQFGDRMACLEGETIDGQRLKGCDSIRTVPDMDGDSLLDVDEAAIGTQPLRFDSDGDGYGDGTEFLVMGTDPLDPLDPKPVVDRARRGAHKRHR